MSKKKKKGSKSQQSAQDKSKQPQDPAPKSRDQSSKFGLNEPTGQFAHLEEKMRKKKKEHHDIPVPLSQLSDSAELKYKQMGWKGIDGEQDEELEPEVEFTKEPIPEDELDMTPMVDVTFLLLIFFMVTASFTLQKSLEQPPAKSDQPSTNNPEEEEILDDYVQVTIDQSNTYYVTTRDSDEVECPSDNEMRARLKDAKETSSATRLIIVAHVDSIHAKVITAWDSGVVYGMEKIEVQTTDIDY